MFGKGSDMVSEQVFGPVWDPVKVLIQECHFLSHNKTLKIRDLMKTRQSTVKLKSYY